MTSTSRPGYAWVTGGGSGIGRALTLRLADAGWQVAISGRRLQALQEVCQQAPADSVFAAPVDVTEPEQLRQVVETEICRQRVPDLVVLNAGDYTPMSLDEFDPQLFERLMRVNYLGVVNCIAAILPSMRPQQAGQILVNASLAGYRGLPRAAPYGASKAALINMAESLRPELLQQGIALRVINPGFVRTDLTAKNSFDMPALIDAEQAAGHIFDGLSRRGFEISFPLRFALFMKLLRILPDALYFPLTRRLAA